MLIIVSSLVFYNELHSKMNIAEILLLAISLIAIIRASLNYINITDTINEGFTNHNHNKHTRKHTSRKHTNTKDDIINLLSSKNTKNTKNTNNTNNKNNTGNSYDTDIYFNTDIKQDTKQNFNTTNTPDTPDTPDTRTINKDAVNQVNSILGISHFDDIQQQQQYKLQAHIPAEAHTTGIYSNNSKGNILQQPNDIESRFEPQIIIGKGNNSKDTPTYDDYDYYNYNNNQNNNHWNKSFTDDNMSFNNTFKPTHNLWGTNTKYSQDTQDSNNDSNSWTQNLNDYNNGKWNPKLYSNPNDYVDYIDTTKPSNNTNINTNTNAQQSSNQASNQNNKKKCGQYNNMAEDATGNLVVSNYTDAKKWVPGYTYVPPIHWDVPQKRASVCQPNNNNQHTKLLGIVDRGLPLNVLELNEDGKIANTEDTVVLSNVGSLIPQFNYQEQPFSKPYI